jgi:hypothetical protein
VEPITPYWRLARYTILVDILVDIEYIQYWMGKDLEDQKRYRDALDSAKQELSDRIRQQEELTERIKWLRATIASLQAMVGEPPELGMLQVFVGLDPDAGITGAVRYFLALNPEQKFTPAEILDGLRSTGFKIPAYSNAFAVLSNVLQRLQKAGEVRASKTPQGHKLVYHWIGFTPPGGFIKHRGHAKKEKDDLT